MSLNDGTDWEDDEEEDDEEFDYGFPDEDEALPEPALPEFDADGNMRVVDNPAVRDETPLNLTHAEQLEMVADMTIVEKADSYGVVRSLQEIIDIIGDDSLREGMKDTPERVIRSWEELYAGYRIDVAGLFTVFSTEEYDEMVLLKGINFYSMCEHHMLPFYGVAHVAYIPHHKLVGLSKLARVVEAYSRRFQNQERLTQQIVTALVDNLQPRGAACVIEGQHMCMACRGVNKPNAIMVTSCLKGAFQTTSTRAELFSLIGGK